MDVKDAIAGTIAGDRDRLTGLSHRLHAHPETAWHEEKAAAWVSAELADRGFDVQTGAFELPTAFIARAGSGPLHIGICAEYDALPGVGHACGHNIIAASSVGAGLALAGVADDLGLTVTVLGTPAEEGGGGKVFMLERGAFDGLHAAMMIHPGPVDVAEARPFAVSHMLVRFRGKATHAAAYPEQGINAADAFTIAQVAIGLLIIAPLAIPAGCRFRTRCPLAQPRCEREDPALVNGPGDPGHLAACHYAFTPVPVTTSAPTVPEQA